MASRDRLPDPKRFQTVVEWQYPRAHRYWDDCGKVMAAVERTFPGLVCQGLQPDGFHFEGLSKGLTGARFYWDRAVVSQVGRGDAGVPDAVGAFWPLIEQGLGIATVSRLGHRTWLCYQTDAVRDALRWLDGFKFVELTTSGASALGTPVAAGSVLRTKLEAGGRRMRLEVNAGTITKPSKKELTNGVIVDVDIVLEPPEASCDFGEFVSWNARFIRERIEPMFQKK